MTDSIRYWTRIVLANLGGALAVTAITSTFAADRSWHQVGRQLFFSMVYANAIGILMALVIPRVAHYCWQRGYRARWLILIGVMVVLTAVGTLLATTLLLLAGIVSARFFWWNVLGSFQIGIVIALIIGIALTVYETVRSDLDDTTAALRAKERDEAEARRLAVEAQLASLESRVNPHFLFNTLNSIASLVHDDPRAAERMTTELAALMRSSLSGQTPLVRLDDELRVARAYLSIEQVRFGARLRYSVDVPPHVGETLVPRLSVQTLVENSVKYAVSPRREGASIEISAARANGRVTVRVQDDGPGFDGSSVSGGHGLALLKSRLAISYEGRATLDIDSQPGRTIVSIDVPADV